MSTRSAYNLYNRADAASLRAAWNAATDRACGRLADALLSRAIHGVAVPVFYKGEQVGERRLYNDRLGMWTLQRRMPEQFGRWRDRPVFSREDPDGLTRIFQRALRGLVNDLLADEREEPRPKRAPIQTVRHMDDPEEIAAADGHRLRLREMMRKAELDAWSKRLELIKRGEIDPTDPASFARWEAEQAHAAAAHLREATGAATPRPELRVDAPCN